MIVLVIAPHPDDETLGCGGTLLKHGEAGDELHWVVVTRTENRYKFTKKREGEKKKVAELYGFKTVTNLGFYTTRTDTVPLSEMVGSLTEVFRKINPEILYVPFRYDIHTDHQFVFDSAASCMKWFRFPSLKKIMIYETISETEFNMRSQNNFSPNVFVNIEEYIDKKIQIMGIYSDEMGLFPFPRSEENIRALATYRGASSGFRAAEAFMLLKETIV